MSRLLGSAISQDPQTMARELRELYDLNAKFGLLPNDEKAMDAQVVLEHGSKRLSICTKH